MAGSKKETRRGSPEAIAKRRAARALNRLFSESGAVEQIDARTLRRKQRLLGELKDGRKGEALKALEVLGHATELLTMGETLRSLRRLKPKLPPTPGLDAGNTGVIGEVQKLYGFDPRAWQLLGVKVDDTKAEAPAAREKKAEKVAKRPARRKKKATR
ncbi:MAG: hypothetical protein KC619_19130 [Myxococcales bacterium]|nr:hypothetical protein [Myxococcales bacterium]